MKRWLIVGLAALPVTAAAAAVVGVPAISHGRAEAELVERIGAWTGGSVTLHDEPVVTFFPSPGIEVRNVTVSGPTGAKDPPLVTIPSLKASLDVLALLTGRVEMGALTLIEPRIHLVDDGNGSGNWSGSPALGDAASGAASSGDAHRNDIVLSDGTITYERRRPGRTVAVTSVNLRLAWPHITQAAALTGSFVWHGTRIEIDAELEDPRAVRSGRGSLGRLTLAAEPEPSSAKEGKGEAAGIAGPRGEDASDLSGPAPQLLGQWLDMPIDPGAGLGALSIAGTFALDGAWTTLSDATVEVAGNTARGDLALALAGERPAIRGQLVFEELDLASYVGALRSEIGADVLASPRSAKGLAFADVALEASADAVDLGLAQLSETKASLFTRDGRMTLSLDAAGLGGGRLAAKLAVEPAAEGIAVHMSGRLDDVSLEELWARSDRWAVWRVNFNPLLMTDEPLQGTGAASFDLSARGATIPAIAESLAGWGVAYVRDGSVYGADIVSTLERIVDGEAVMAGDSMPLTPAAGRTYFAGLTAHLAAGDGSIRAERVRIVGERFEVALSGEGDLRHGEIEAEGIASLSASEASDRQLDALVELPFGVGGTVREPLLAPGIPRIGYELEKPAGSTSGT